MKQIHRAGSNLALVPTSPLGGPGACCHVYFTFTRGVNTLHIVNIFALGCHVFLEKLNIRKTNGICLHFYHVQHFPFPFLPLHPRSPPPRSLPLISSICRAGQARLAVSPSFSLAWEKCICLSLFFERWFSLGTGFLVERDLSSLSAPR